MVKRSQQRCWRRPLEWTFTCNFLSSNIPDTWQVLIRQPGIYFCLKNYAAFNVNFAFINAKINRGFSLNVSFKYSKSLSLDRLERLSTSFWKLFMSGAMSSLVSSELVFLNPRIMSIKLFRETSLSSCLEVQEIWLIQWLARKIS